MRRPFFRNSTLSWYVELACGKRMRLSRDKQFETAPKEKPKEPPPSVQKEYPAVIRWQAELRRYF